MRSSTCLIRKDQTVRPIGDEQIVSGSSGSATTAMWRADGKELFYLENGTLMSVQIETNGDRLIPGEPRPLFKVNVEDQERRNRYLVSREGLFFVRSQEHGELAVKENQPVESASTCSRSMIGYSQYHLR